MDEEGRGRSRGQVEARGGPAMPAPEPEEMPEPEQDEEPAVVTVEPERRPIVDGDLEQMNERAVELALNMLLGLPLKWYGSGNSGAEIHLRRELELMGHTVPVSIHVTAVIWPNGFQGRGRRKR